MTISIFKSYRLISTEFITSLGLSDSLIILLTCVISLYLIQLVRAIFAPIRYKLDMTKKEYCKQLGEVNNEFGAHKNLGAAKIDRTGDIENLTKNRSLLDESPLKEEEFRYVNGWIPVVESAKVGPGQIKKATLYGKDLIVTRSEDGQQVNILDAYCPHGGAHIGVGGLVRKIDEQSCVQCPFHGWSFRASDGICVDIPYQTKRCIPSQAKITSWTCCEIDDFIYLWHDMDGNPPKWTMTPTRELTNRHWVQSGRSCHISNLELEYMQENGADMNHFAGIHEDLIFLGNVDNLPGNKYLQKYVKHSWEPDWKPINDRFGRPTHMAQLTLRSYMTIFGFKIFEFNLVANQIGPARVKLLYDSKWLGRGMLSMNAIPVSGRRVKYIQHVYSQPTFIGRLQAKIVLFGEIKMLERDQVVWNHKKYLKNPILVPEDKTIKKFKLWYSQFYKRKIKIEVKDCATEQDMRIGSQQTDCKAHDSKGLGRSVNNLEF